MDTTVINIYSLPGKQIPKTGQYIYIGRAGNGNTGEFGNPVAIGKTCPECGEVHSDGGSTLPCYTAYLKRRLKAEPKFRQQIKDLQGKILVCFCKPRPCHGDVLVKATEYLNRS
jgi:hypothetical protein